MSRSLPALFWGSCSVTSSWSLYCCLMSMLDNPSREQEEALAAMGYTRRDRPDSFPRFKGDSMRGQGQGARSFQKIEKPVYPERKDCVVLSCKSCGSHCHMINCCPHSYENLSKSGCKPTNSGFRGGIAQKPFNSEMLMVRLSR